MSYPKRIMIIRHAEKTDEEEDIHLSLQGKRRANALVGLFGPQGRLSGTQYIMATDRSKHSNRSVETVAPTARVLGLDINHDYEDDEYKALASRLKSGRKYRDTVVLICWHHGNIPNLARALGVASKALPWREWPDDVYDRVWILTYGSEGLTSILSGVQGVIV